LITTVTLNPCMDTGIILDEFLYGGLNRVDKNMYDVGGKGINVSVVIKMLGIQSVCTGINYFDNKEILEKFLNKKGIGYDFVLAPGRLRNNIKIFDKKTGTITEINEKGSFISDEIIYRLKEKIIYYARQSDILILSGSVPQGVDTSIYGQIINDVRNLPVKVILDADGSLLKAGIHSKPYMIKPNIYELEGIMGRKFKNIYDIIDSSRSLVEQGISLVIVSMGDGGAVAVDKKSAYFAPALSLDVKSAVGAGDSMVAAAAAAIIKGLDLADTLKMASAAASATVIQSGTKLCGLSDFEYMLDRIKIIPYK
jgi:1-phosphofructokinase